MLNEEWYEKDDKNTFHAVLWGDDKCAHIEIIKEMTPTSSLPL